MSTPRRVALVLGVLVFVAGAGALAYALTRTTVEDIANQPPPASSAPAGQDAAGPAPAERLRVADLMARADCRGEVIETQLYSYETGRCQHAGGEVTIAVFDSDELRDQWVAFGKSYGGSYAIGDGWAAAAESPDAAAAVAAALGGTT